MEWHKTTIGILALAIIAITFTTCKKKTTAPDSPPTITSYQPSEYLLTQKVGDTINFEALANDADEDSIEYKTLKDGVQVNDTNTFEFIIDEIGNFLIKIIAFNAEADTAEWQVNVENQAPVINLLGDVSDNEDEVDVGGIVHILDISDNEDTLDGLTLQLTQTNPDLIKFILDGENRIIIEDYRVDGNGSSLITIKVIDSHGAYDEVSFTYTVNPMSDFSGTILDTDPQEPNLALQAWIVIDGDTTQADGQGYYFTQSTPTSALEIKAGYKQDGVPISYVTTIRDIDASDDIIEFDIAVVTYLNMNTTPEEFRIMMDEANFNETGNISYNGAKALRTDMSWNIYQTGRYGDTFSEEEITTILNEINIINGYLKNPLPINVDRTGWFPTTDVTSEVGGKIIIEKEWIGPLGSISSKDYNNDGRVDVSYVGFMDPVIYPGATREECASALGGLDPVWDEKLNGKTIFYELGHEDVITTVDIKSFRMIESITYQVGNLWPKMPIEDILKLQE